MVLINKEGCHDLRHFILETETDVGESAVAGFLHLFLPFQNAVMQAQMNCHMSYKVLVAWVSALDTCSQTLMAEGSPVDGVCTGGFEGGSETVPIKKAREKVLFGTCQLDSLLYALAYTLDCQILCFSVLW